MTKSILQEARAAYQPQMPRILQGPLKAVEGEITESVADKSEIQAAFPMTYGMRTIAFERGPAIELPPINVGVILSGGQAPGGHNVIAGLFDGIRKINPASQLYGFLLGPDGLIKHKYRLLTDEIINEYRNTGGFDIIGSGRTKLSSKEQFDEGLQILKELNITALVIIGGDDSNTNACHLAEYYKAINAGVQVIGCPKTIDGDLKNEQIETSFGFDTACKVYSELIGNIERDCNSAQKYWHFIKLMGRSASHIALECAQQTQPNVCLISEEVYENSISLDQIVSNIANIIIKRGEAGQSFGTVLIPEGLIEFIPEFKPLISTINALLAKESSTEQEFKQLPKSERRSWMQHQLEQGTGPDAKANAALYKSLPEVVALQLALDRDSHGNVQVSLIETEKMISEMVAAKLPTGQVWKFSPQHHFFGYEGRCAAPSNYDANYCYSLGYTASCLIATGKSGYMASVRNTTAPASEWIAGGIPITMMMNMETKEGKRVPVIRKALVDLNDAPFQTFAAARNEWALNTSYLYPGPIQYFGPTEVCDRPTQTLLLEKSK
ncbi:MAG: diphosphate--fructose-6-phosphate 1-phosphotransferase [Tannerellaceae bacterium]|jgi:pyrophosphate--fructose-6-phosphate 1-phosphotransferase|nr:diphosphate--fructose-6-phosphate 1-phosphotransferase [Tannerellaceae bacterium]